MGIVLREMGYIGRCSEREMGYMCIVLREWAVWALF